MRHTATSGYVVNNIICAVQQNELKLNFIWYSALPLNDQVGI